MVDAREKKSNYCEWILSCYGGDPRRAVANAISRRHRHHGYMASYPQALALVREAADTGREPLFASWF